MIQLSDLPPVRGRYQFDVPLKNMTWFAVGGPAEVLYKPKDQEDLFHFLKHITSPTSNMALTTLGAGSNVIVRDGGIAGVTVKLGRFFSEIEVKEDIVEVGTGCLDRTLALTCQQYGLSGLEFFVGIPGSIGGALAMNAGAYGTETADLLQWVEGFSPDGSFHRLSPNDMGFSYRHCGLPQGWIFTKAAFKCVHGDKEHIEHSLREILKRRHETQPVQGKTGGSTFKNPTPHSAWELIDRAGCRGLTEGDAKISEKHCNFMLNLGQACAKDLETLGEKVRKMVRDACGVDLSWEIQRLGIS